MELRPDLAEIHINLGVVFKEQEKLDEAVACYRRALELRPDFAELHVNLGVALKDQGKLEEALPAIAGHWNCTRIVPRPMSTWALP